jgi:hypothetical protein
MTIAVKASSRFSRNGLGAGTGSDTSISSSAIACIDSTGRLLVHGRIGSGTTPDVTHKELERYNPANDTWSTLAASQQYVELHGWIIDSSDRIIYATGHVNDPTVGAVVTTIRGEIYDPVGNAWSSIPSLPVGANGRYGAMFFKDASGRLNLLTGQRTASVGYSGYQDEVASGGTQTDGWRYSGGASGTWTNIPSTGATAAHPQHEAAGPDPPMDATGHPWAVCGANVQGATGDLQVYDPGTAVWTSKASCPEIRTSHSCLWGSDGLLYVAGGWNASAVVYNTSWKYDPVGNAWTQLANLPRAVGFAPMVEFGGYLYIVGGFGPNPGYAPLSAITRYDKVANTWTDTADVLSVARTRPLVVKSLAGDGFWIYSGQSVGPGTEGGFTNVLEWWVPESPTPTAHPRSFGTILG